MKEVWDCEISNELPSLDLYEDWMEDVDQGNSSDLNDLYRPFVRDGAAQNPDDALTTVYGGSVMHVDE
jgi:hypothetical protein